MFVLSRDRYDFRLKLCHVKAKPDHVDSDQHAEGRGSGGNPKSKYPLVIFINVFICRMIQDHFICKIFNLSFNLFMHQ